MTRLRGVGVEGTYVGGIRARRAWVTGDPSRLPESYCPVRCGDLAVCMCANLEVVTRRSR